MLGGTQLLYLDGIDKLKKNGLAKLGEYIAHPSPFAYLVLGANSGKNLSDLYTQGKKELVVCDLSEEKPWDRKDRLKRFLIDEAANAGKRLQGEAVDYLLENVGLQLSNLDQELTKLIAYAGEKGDLSLKDVRSLCSSQKSNTLWQLAEAIIWSEDPPRIDETADLSLLLPLLSQLRTQLQQGMVLAVLLERGTAHHLPTLKASTLDKMLPAAKGRTSVFFRKALDHLFEIELMAKNSSFDPSFILDLFIAKITLLKKKHALSFPQSSRRT
jgi:DNA polymerase-3 subunit delta